MARGEIIMNNINLVLYNTRRRVTNNITTDIWRSIIKAKKRKLASNMFFESSVISESLKRAIRSGILNK